MTDRSPADKVRTDLSRSLGGAATRFPVHAVAETTRQVRVRLVDIIQTPDGKMAFELDGNALSPVYVASIGAMMVSWARPRIEADAPDAGSDSPAGPR